MVFMAIISFFSCNNDMKNVIKVSELEKVPELSGDNIHFTQSEYGKIVISIRTPIITESKNEDDSKKMEFPKGISVVQFSSYPDTSSMITANYAINHEDKGIWIAQGNVIAQNNKDRLNTEYLVWDQKKGIIYTDKKVQVTTPDDIILGEGFSADDQFNEWEVENVTGVFSIEGGVPLLDEKNEE